MQSASPVPRAAQARHARKGRSAPVLWVTGGLAALAIAVAGAAAASHRGGIAPDPVTVTAAAGLDAAAKQAPPAPAKPAVFTVVAAGDVLLHDPVTASATHGGRVDYSPLLAGMDNWVRGADLALCHFETPVVPPGKAVSTYPVFGVPPHIVTDLVEQGWDGCSTASNHSIDRGYPGVTATLDAFDAAGLGHSGTARSQAEADAPQLYRLEREGRTITVAHIAMAYGLNGFSLPKAEPWAVSLIDVDKAVDQARTARKAGADLVIVSLHAGTEYQASPTQEQLDVTRKLAASGVVDLVLGHHAHVPQPIAKLDGGPDGEGMWVAYGMGNFLSNQSASCCTPATSNGELVTATVKADPGRPAHVTDLEWTATTVDREAGHRVRTIVDAKADPGAGTLSRAELDARARRVHDVVGTQAPERTAPPTPTGPEPEVVPHVR
jgi:poly-gamma-glutamate synthesis protein (capsule biosynthesis protein)